MSFDWILEDWTAEKSTNFILATFQDFDDAEHVEQFEKDDHVQQRAGSSESENQINCGESTFHHEVFSLVKGGTDFKPGTFPWIAALFNNLEFICGGSIVSEKIIVTGNLSSFEVFLRN